MDAPIEATQIHCPNCGGELHPDEGQLFLTCPFCSSTVFLDKSRVVFHWYLAPTLNEEQARASLNRWMAGNQTVKDLDKKSKVVSASFEYFPLWMFKRQQAGKEDFHLLPAAATSISEITHLNLPAGDLRKYDPSLSAQATPPSVPLQAALSWLDQARIPRSEIAEQSLAHIPIYTFKYTFQSRLYTAVVEGGTGSVLANIYPAKSEAPYRTAGCVTATVFLILALVPVIMGISGQAAGTGIGLLVCFGLGLIAAPFLFALAAWVALKI